MKSFWKSTHFQQQKEMLKNIKNKPDENTGSIQFSAKEKKYLFYMQFLHIRDGGRKLKLHQRVISTAMVYFNRFYSVCGIGDCDPELIVYSSLLLASKIEESSINKEQIYSILEEGFPYNIADILESEPYLMGEINFCLVVYHPYEAAHDFMKKIGKEKDEVFKKKVLNIINDSYITNVSLFFAPHLIAITAIYMTCNLTGEKEMDSFKKWVHNMNVDMKKIGTISKKITSMYMDMKEFGSNCVRPLIKLNRLRENKGWIQKKR